MNYVVIALLALPVIGAYALFSLGIVVIYRASRVLNLAHGAMAVLPAYVTYGLAQKHIGVPLAVAAGVLSGGLLGLIIERFIIRTLKAQSVTTQTIGTVAAFGLILALVAKIFGTTPVVMPTIFPRGFVRIGLSGIGYGSLGLFFTMLVLASLMFALFRFTALGLAMRAAAENARAAQLMGVNPKRTTEIAWALGGLLAGVAGILLASVSTLDPYNLSLQALPAFVAVLIGGLESLPGALVGAVIVGGVVGIVPGLPALSNIEGAPQLFLVGIAFVVMARRGQRLSAGELRA